MKVMARARNPRRTGRTGNRHLDACGASFLAVTIATLLAVLFTIAAPNAIADKHDKTAHSSPDAVVADSKFKGHLPITELTEDQAILHALNRLAYGPRPGDVERIRQMGLEKWIDQQLHPDSIDDSALDKRLEKYPTLKMSARELLDRVPAPSACRQSGWRDQGRIQTADGGKAPRSARSDDGPDHGRGRRQLDRAQQQLAKMQGPNRIIAELSMAKLDRAVYSQRQLEAVMEDFWFNHFNVFANKGADKWMLTAYVRDTIRPHTMGKFQDLLVATAKSPAMLFFLDNWQSVDPVAFKDHQQEIAMRRARYQGIFGGGLPPSPGTFPGPTRVSRKRRAPHAQSSRIAV